MLHKKADKTFWAHCPIVGSEYVKLSTCKKCPWYDGLYYTELKETIEAKEPWAPDTEVYKFATVICTFE